MCAASAELLSASQTKPANVRHELPCPCRWHVPRIGQPASFWVWSTLMGHGFTTAWDNTINPTSCMQSHRKYGGAGVWGRNTANTVILEPGNGIRRLQNHRNYRGTGIRQLHAVAKPLQVPRSWDSVAKQRKYRGTAVGKTTQILWYWNSACIPSCPGQLFSTL